MDKQLIYNAVQCLNCNEILVSYHRHDYKICGCEQQTSVDGGTDYIRYGGKDLNLVKSLVLYDNEPFEKIREVICRGGRGKNGDRELKYTPIKDMDDEWLKAVIDYEEQKRPNNPYLKYYYQELNFRKNE